MIKWFRLLAFSGLTALAATSSPAVSAAEKADPFHIYMAVWRGCEDACKGFQDYFRDNKIPARFTVRDAGRDKSKLPGFVQEARALKADLVVTWGTSVTRIMLGPWNKPDPDKHVTKIPAVFMIVADPIGAKVVRDYDSSGRPNVTGTRNRAPTAVQFKALQSYKKFKRIGLIYNTNELNARLNAAQVRETAKEMGLDLIEVTLPLGEDGKPSPDTIEAAVSEVAAKKAEFLYMGSSSFLTKFRKPFTEAAIKYNLPVAAGTEVPVTKAGGLMAIASRYYNVGQLAADQARRVLVDKQSPGEIRIRRLRRFSFIINMETARKLKLYPPMEILRYAEVIKAGPTQ
tara:strand:+ start:1482 stop:2513 length:1032 start_codon:yes stop_codon:yes gene_type:complete